VTPSRPLFGSYGDDILDGGPGNDHDLFRGVGKPSVWDSTGGSAGDEVLVATLTTSPELFKAGAKRKIRGARLSQGRIGMPAATWRRIPATPEARIPTTRGPRSPSGGRGPRLEG
jgi:hypothetical protein